MNYPEFPGVEFMGDVHLGRRFIEGVPLDRRGDRESMIWNQFYADLHCHDGDFHIQVGDLFDNFDVSNDTVLRAATMYISAAQKLSGCQFFVLRGNHDASRRYDKASSFEVFKKIVENVPNIMVVDEPYISLENRFGFMPWDPYRSALMQVQTLSSLLPLTCEGLDEPPLKFVVCHCDVKHYGGDTFNVLPIDELSNLAKHIVTGHDHTKRTFKNVFVTGSMQPYSHGEDPDHTMYLTMSLEELRDTQVDLTNKYVRVMLRPGEETLAVPNCLGFKTQLLGAKEEESDITVEFESFDTVGLFRGILEELKVAPAFSKLVMEKFQENLNG